MLFRTCSGGLGLTNLRWNSFQFAATAAALVSIAPPSFVVNKITSVLGAQGMAASQFTFTVATGVLPAWAQPGAGVAINVTIGGVPILIGGIIKDIPTSTTITISPSSTDAKNITTAWTNQSLDSVGGTVVNTVTLNIICQKAMFQVPTGAGGNVILAPVADSTGANPLYSVTLIAGGAEYEVTAPVGGKFDLADWFAQSSTGTVNLSVRFL